MLGGTSAGLALAPALRVLTWPFLALTIAMLGRGWYLELSRRPSWRSRWRFSWRQRAWLTLVGSTVLAVVLWGLRFAGLIGPAPI
ncbi:MAG: hypothetical protein J4O03_12255 [Chloroflexi bacterium]|nr:hypothetical protein [Chloroflexota bacterium]